MATRAPQATLNAGNVACTLPCSGPVAPSSAKFFLEENTNVDAIVIFEALPKGTSVWISVATINLQSLSPQASGSITLTSVCPASW